MAPLQNILIVGATGLIGKHITKAIVNSKSSFNKVSVLTSPATLTNKAAEIGALKSAGVEILTGDLANEEDVRKAFEGINAVVSCVGRGALPTQLLLIKIASTIPGLTRFFPSEYGTDIKHNTDKSPNEKPHQLKLKVRASLEEVSTQTGLEYTYVVTGPYPEFFILKSSPEEAGSFDAQAKKAVLLGDGTGKISFTNMDDVGKLVAGALLHPEASANKALIVNSFTATPLEILQTYERLTGGQPWAVSYTSLEQLKEIEQKAWAEGNPVATIFTLKRIWTEGGTLYPGREPQRDNGLIGEPEMITLEGQVKELIDATT